MLFFGLESANDRILSIIEKGCDQATEKRVLENSSSRGNMESPLLVFRIPNGRKT